MSRPITYRIGGSPEVMKLLDVQISNEGSIFTFYLQSPAAHEWVSENVHEPNFMGNNLIVEHRYAVELAEGMIEAGLRLA
jgi:hypothetical protein